MMTSRASQNRNNLNQLQTCVVYLLIKEKLNDGNVVEFLIKVMHSL